MTVAATPAHRRLQPALASTSAGAIEYARCGSGPAVLLVHGLPGSWRQLAPLALDLAGAHTLVLPSRPGYGRTPASSGREPGQQADAFAALLDELGLERAAVVGVSGGGPSAAAFAVRHADRTDALVLCCPLAPHLMTPPTAMRVGLAVPGLAASVLRVQRALEHRRLRDASATDRRLEADLTPAERTQLVADPGLREALVAFARSHLDAPVPAAGIRHDRRWMGFGGPPPDLAGVGAPTTVVHGDADPVVPLAHAEWYAGAIAGASLEVLPGAGHAFLLTFRPQALDLVERALAPATASLPLRGTPSGGGRGGRGARRSGPRTAPRPSP